MRYLLPLVPTLGLMAALGVSQVRFSRVWGAVLTSFALVGALNVLWPFTQTDPRDQVIAAVPNPKNIVLWHRPWYYSPPTQPQGFNLPVAGIATAERPPGTPDAPFVVSELEWREWLRLGRLDIPVVGIIANSSVKPRARFKNSIPLALPGRAFVPHDYLYTNPEMRIY
jgi:hypothetical protein